MAPSLGTANQIPQNQNTSATQTTEQQTPMDMHGPSQQQLGVPPMISPIEQYSREEIREEVQRTVCLAREQEIHIQVDLILDRDRLVREERKRLDEEAAHAEHEHRKKESYRTDDPPYTPTYSPLYTNSMLPEYGSARTISYSPLVVHQTIPPADSNAALL
ncbi:hypothetical protein LIER_33262 [Lithospermum erythrorhizon]|uniref:Uncharacterized protein n=1 Tax=Lithospermum erythrorhizon TaxID=34254 RepID=A0AAV3RZW4_LITER